MALVAAVLAYGLRASQATARARAAKIPLLRDRYPRARVGADGCVRRASNTVALRPLATVSICRRRMRSSASSCGCGAPQVTQTVGVKVGYANKAMWRVLKLDTLVWAHMYDDTVRYAERERGHALARAMISPKIEPEIVFKLKAPLGAAHHGGGRRARGRRVARARVRDHRLSLRRLEVSARRLRRRLWSARRAHRRRAASGHGGEHRRRSSSSCRPSRSGSRRRTDELRAHGRVGPANSLRSPALCLGRARVGHARKQDGAEPLAAGDLVSSGTLTESTPIQPGATWTASVEGIDLSTLTLTLV